MKSVKSKTEIRLTPEIRARVEEFVERCEYYKNSYFWASPLSASQRRSREQKDSIDLYKFQVNDDIYKIRFDVEMSCKNVYAKSYIYKNGERTTLTVIKTLLRKDRGLQSCQFAVDKSIKGDEI